jgi:3-deoxy-D-manno-octulosonate 8-phosphate phosphatase (KDO 8-P phosphatase)
MTPRLNFPPALLLQAQGPDFGMKAAIFDVDGVLTDGRIYIGEQGETVKAFATLDGHGIKLLARAGITPIVITGRDSAAVRRRVADLATSWRRRKPCCSAWVWTGPRWPPWATTGPTCRC